MDSGVYEIGGRTFTQKKLVWGQVKQLNEIVKGVQFPAMGWSLAELIGLLGDKVPEVLAIILREGEGNLKDKDLDALALFMEENAEIDTIVRVFEDFFSVNPITYVLGKLSVGMRELTKKMSEASTKPLSTEPLPSSPEETSQSETK
jgi:hypothetical protein